MPDLPKRNTSVTDLRSGAAETYDDGVLRVEPENYYAACGGDILRLARAEFLIISRLVQTPERVVTQEELWETVWGSQKKYNQFSLRVYIHRLRQYIEPYGIKIKSMVGVGYRFIPAPQSRS